MNSIRMILNYLESSNIMAILTFSLIIIVTYLLLSSDISIFSEESSICIQKKNDENSTENLKKDEDVNKSKEDEERSQKIEMKGFQQNEIKEGSNKFKLGKKTENIEHLSQKINNINNKNDELSIMFIEGLSSLNSWENESLGNEILKKIEWNLEKRENEKDGVIFQYVYPHNKINNNNNLINNNLSSSQDSLNSLTETEDGEEEKEKQILSSYKLGICKIFEKEENIKSNIVKEMSDKFYKIYSQGEPESIKKLCKSDTLPEDYEKIILKNKEEGNEVLCLCGKKVKMSYLQCQRIERNKCESNMIFLGFVFYRRIEKGHNPGYS
jgi:hypothetical protein